MKKAITIFFILAISNCFAQDIRPELKQDLRAGKYEEALSLLENQKDSVLINNTDLFDALNEQYLFENNWNSIVSGWTKYRPREYVDTSLLSLARYFSRFPGEKTSPQQKICMRFKRSISGTPIINVKVNGKKYRFWLDTGAGMTVVSSDIAIDCRVIMPVTQTGLAGTATGSTVGISPGVIDSLNIGGKIIFNHKCIVINKKDLEFRILGIRFLKIDGIIGWNLLQNSDVEINNHRKTICFAPANIPSDQAVHNFFWSGKPFIECKDQSGNPLLFFIDTGASQSGLYRPFLAKTDTDRLKKKTIRMGSAGGFRKITSYILPELKLLVGGQVLRLKKLSVYPNDSDNLFPSDGTLGIYDIKKHNIHFNVRKGFFVLAD